MMGHAGSVKQARPAAYSIARDSRLPRAAASRISPAMRTFPICSLALSLCLSLGASAMAAASNASPKQLGKFGDWTAAVYEQSGKKVCYAFTRAASSKPALPGRSEPILTVTERPGTAESVAMEAGFAYAPKAAVTVTVDEQTRLDFYTAQRNAFARDSKAAVAAFQKGREAVAHSPAPKGKEVDDTFSLHGFSDAHDAILKACPGK